MKTQKAVEIARIRVGEKQLLIHLQTFRSRPFIDARLWFVDADGCLKPTRAGLTLSPGQARKMARAIRRAAKGAKS